MSRGWRNLFGVSLLLFMMMLLVPPPYDLLQALATKSVFMLANKDDGWRMNLVRDADCGFEELG